MTVTVVAFVSTRHERAINTLNTREFRDCDPETTAHLPVSWIRSHCRHRRAVPVYHALLQQDHVHLPSAATRLAPVSWTAADVMGSEVNLVPAGRRRPREAVGLPRSVTSRRLVGCRRARGAPTARDRALDSRTLSNTCRAASSWHLSPSVTLITIRRSRRTGEQETQRDQRAEDHEYDDFPMYERGFALSVASVAMSVTKRPSTTSA
jgi:hypothetical protein